MVQSLLCRWWYAVDGPGEADHKVPPGKGYRPLPGMPGVFVCTATEALGSIKDTRNKALLPSFANFSRMPAEELQRLCIRAYEEQIRVLLETYGGNDANSSSSGSNGELTGEHRQLLHTLRAELSKIRKINAAKAEAEATKFNRKLGIAA